MHRQLAILTLLGMIAAVAAPPPDAKLESMSWDRYDMKGSDGLDGTHQKIEKDEDLKWGPVIDHGDDTLAFAEKVKTAAFGKGGFGKPKAKDPTRTPPPPPHATHLDDMQGSDGSDDLDDLDALVLKTLNPPGTTNQDFTHLRRLDRDTAELLSRSPPNMKGSDAMKGLDGLDDLDDLDGLDGDTVEVLSRTPKYTPSRRKRSSDDMKGSDENRHSRRTRTTSRTTSKYTPSRRKRTKQDFTRPVIDHGDGLDDLRRLATKVLSRKPPKNTDSRRTRKNTPSRRKRKNASSTDEETGSFEDPSQGPLQASILAGPSVDLHGDVQLCRETQLTSMYFTLKETLNKVADGVDKMDTDLIQRLLEKEGFEVVDDVLKRTREAMKDYIKQVDNIFTTAADIEDAAEAKKQTIGALTKLFLDERIQDLLKDDCASSNAVASSVNVLVDFKKALEGGPDALVRFHNRHSELHKPDVVGRLAAQKKIEERQKKLAKANDKEVEFLQNRVASLQQQLDEATSKLAEKQSDGLGIEERLEGIQELACKQTGQYLGEAKDFICASYSQVNHLLSQNDANCRDAREKAKMLERMFLKAQLNLAKIHSDTPFEDRDDIGWKVEVSKLKTTLQVTLEQLHHEIQIIKQKCADMPPSLSGHLNTMALLMLEVSQQFNLGLTEDLYYFCVNWTMLGKRCSTGDFEGLSKKYRKAKHFKPDGSGFYHLRKTNAGAVDGGQHGYRGAAKPTRKGKARRKQAKRGRH